MKLKYFQTEMARKIKLLIDYVGSLIPLTIPHNQSRKCRTNENIAGIKC